MACGKLWGWGGGAWGSKVNPEGRSGDWAVGGMTLGWWGNPHSSAPPQKNLEPIPE